MDFEIRNLKESVVGLSRKIGYLIIDSDTTQYNMVRKLTGGHYPRFHLYARQSGWDYAFSLHLDQKKPIYEGAHAHNGEYFGPLIDEERERIEAILR